jgi:hypothetical protein
MSVATPIYTVSKDTATPWVKDFAARCEPERLKKIIARAGTNILKRHIESLPKNKQGWPTTNFWKDASRNTSGAVTSTGAIFTINKLGFRQRLQGGIIKPVNRRRLAFPARAEAYGKTPGEFDNLRIGKGYDEKGKPGFGLVEAPRTEIKRTKKGFRATVTRLGLRLFFYFARSVNQKPNPSVLPTDAAFLEALAYELDRALPVES